MNLYLWKEVQLISYSMIFGCCILLYYDFFRVFRTLVIHKDIFVALEDFIFWITISIAMFSMFYYYNNGEIRFYYILGMGIGMCFYGFCFSRFFMKGNEIIWRFLKKLLRKNKKKVIIVYSTVKDICNGNRKNKKVSLKERKSR